MAHLSSNTESPKRDLGYSRQLANFILDSGATYHMTPEISDFIPGSMVERDKYIEGAYRHFFT